MKKPFVTLSLFVLVLSLRGVVEPGFAQEDDVVTLPTGARLKVIARNDSAIFEKPDKSSRSRPLKRFQFFYVLRPRGGGEKMEGDFYRVSATPRASDEQGYVHRDDVIEWSHRQAVKFTARGGRDLANFYRSAEDLRAAYGAGPSPRPFSRETKSTRGVNLLPILNVFSVEVDGDETRGYEVAYLHGPGGSSTSNGAAQPLVDLRKSVLQICFVLDSTASMGPHIAATIEVIRRVANQLAQQGGGEGPAVQFALVCYRDVIAQPSGDWYVTKLVCDFEQGADHQEFLRRLSRVREARLNSEDFPEHVLGGLAVAIKQATWDPHAFRHIVLVGDASCHLDSSGPKNPERYTIDGILALAQPRGLETVREKIAVHAIQILGDSPEDRPICEKHFKLLAAGSDTSGLFRSFDSRQGTPQFIDELVDIILRSRRGLAQAQRGKQPDPETPALGLVLQMVDAAEGGGQAPEFARGFACEIDKQGRQVLEPHVLVEYSRVDLYTSALDFIVKALRDVGEPGKRDVKKLIANMQLFSTGVHLGEALDADTPISHYLGMVLGVPVRSRIFAMSLNRLAAMSAADFESWVNQLEANKSIMRAHLENQRVWFSLGPQAPLEHRHAFLRVNDLP